MILAPLGQFDLVCGNGILHHLVVRLPEVLALLHRLTTSGGGLAFIEPNLLNPYCAFIFGTRLGRRWARLELRRNGLHAGTIADSAAGRGLDRGVGGDKGLPAPGACQRHSSGPLKRWNRCWRALC